jgi:hypothetical protein
LIDGDGTDRELFFFNGLTLRAPELRRQHQDWDLSRGDVCFQHFADFQPGHLWQEQIEDNERRRFFPGLAKSGRAVRGGAQGKARLAEMKR